MSISQYREEFILKNTEVNEKIDKFSYIKIKSI